MAISDVAAFAHLSDDDVEALGREFDAIRQEIEESRGGRDAAYIRRIITIQRQLMVAGRLTLFASSFPPAWVAGTALLGGRQDPREHGDRPQRHARPMGLDERSRKSTRAPGNGTTPARPSSGSTRTTSCTTPSPTCSGKDNDVGYGILRVTSDQKWHPVNLGQPVYNALLALLFEWGVALHDLDIEAIRKREKDSGEMKRQLKGIWRKVRRQVGKDYSDLPVADGPELSSPRSRPT